MMVDFTSGGGFGGAIDYDRDLNGRHNKDARIINAEGVDVFYATDGQLDADSRQLARSFRAQAMMNLDVRKCVKHLWISYMPEDPLVMINNVFKGTQRFNSIEEATDTLGQQRIAEITDKAMVEDAKRLLNEMKYDNTQFLIVRHSEKDNPHVHVIVNMVDNDGKRLNDFQEKKRGIKICREITLERNYTWGQHKSLSRTLSHNPKENVRAEIVKEIFDISKKCNTAEELKMDAARRGIEVKYSTNYRTGKITGISFAREGFLFPALMLDSSLSAKKLFPAQVESPVPLSALSEEFQIIVKAGGIVRGFNDQILDAAIAPELPKSVQESMTRDEYHKAIKDAEKAGSRTAYIQNIVGLALDPKCGSSKGRAEEIAPYIIDAQTDQTADVQHIHEIVCIADEQTKQMKSLFQRFIYFLSNLLQRALDFKKYSILKEKGYDIIRWIDLREGVPGRVVGLASELRMSVEQAYNASNVDQVRKQTEKQETTNRLSREQNQGQLSTAQSSRQDGFSRIGQNNKGIKFHK